MRKIGIIGGTGIYSPDALKDFETKIIETPYGKALCGLGTMAGNQVAFITRHGVGHTVAPHMINYRANIWALKSLGTEEIFATSATGSLNPAMTAGHFVVCDQLLDFTKSRVSTFYDNPVRGVAHVPPGPGSGNVLHQCGHRHEHGRRHFPDAPVPRRSAGGHGRIDPQDGNGHYGLYHV